MRDLKFAVWENTFFVLKNGCIATTKLALKCEGFRQGKPATANPQQQHQLPCIAHHTVIMPPRVLHLIVPYFIV